MGFRTSILLTVVLAGLTASASSADQTTLPEDVVVSIVESEINTVKELKKKPICLTVDGGDAPSAVMRRLRKRGSRVSKSGVCFQKQKGVDIILESSSSSPDQIDVLVKVRDPRIEEGCHFAILLWETNYNFQRDSTGKWIMVSKTRTCCDE